MICKELYFMLWATFKIILFGLLMLLLIIIVDARCQEAENDTNDVPDVIVTEQPTQEIELKQEVHEQVHFEELLMQEIEQAQVTNKKDFVHIEEVHTHDECGDEEIQEPSVSVNEAELEMLACLIYQEAGGDKVCDECRFRVADIVLNRMKHDGFPNTMHEVLTQKGQYGVMHYTGVVWLDRATAEGERPAVQRAYETAYDVLSGNRHSELYDNGYIWQAEFVQGTEGFWHCGIYFGK